MAKGEGRRIKIYFTDEWPHEERIAWVWNIIWMGHQDEHDIYIRRGMPWWLFSFVVFHEVTHWIYWRFPPPFIDRYSFLEAYITVSMKFWKIYEKMAFYVGWRWSCKQKGLI